MQPAQKQVCKDNLLQVLGKIGDILLTFTIFKTRFCSCIYPKKMQKLGPSYC